MAGGVAVTYVDDNTLAAIDQRIRLAQRKTSANGTMVTRDTTGPGCTVLHDGATIATPAKCLGSVFANAGDRVVLDLYGSEWLVTGSFSSLAFGEGSRALDGLPSAATPITSATFVDLTEFGSFSFSKAYDNTFVRVGLTASCFSSVATTRVFWGVRLVQTAGVSPYGPTDLTMGGFMLNTVNIHTSFTKFKRYLGLADGGIPAGTYTVSLRWRRFSGTGTLSADTNDDFALELDERVRALAPIL